MGVFKQSASMVGKAAKYAAVDMPASIFGIRTLRSGNAHIRDLVRSLTNPVCPSCDKGTLACSAEPTVMADGASLYHWLCPQCGDGIYGSRDPSLMRAVTQGLRNERVAKLLPTMEAEQLRLISKNHLKSARFMLVLTGLCVLSFLWLIAANGSLMYAFNWMALSIFTFTMALKRAFRSWQVSTQQLFVKGAFVFWLKNEKWFW